MLIAFEGSRHRNNTVSANRLGGGRSIPKAMPGVYEETRSVRDQNIGLVQCFDGIGWLSGLAHSLVGQDAGYVVSAPHQMFVMPDTHLVFSLTRRGYSGDTTLNRVYTGLAHTFMALNEDQDYKLFKTVTIVEHQAEIEGQGSRMEVVEFSSPLQPSWRPSVKTRLVHDDLTLFDMLAFEEAQL